MDRSQHLELEKRVDERARSLWEEAGRPKGGPTEFRRRAQTLVAIEDNPDAATQPVPSAADRARPDADAEPLEAIENQGEFPGLTDQGEGSAAPRRRRSS